VEVEVDAPMLLQQQQLLVSLEHVVVVQHQKH
jgi:hypothetical protein